MSGPCCVVPALHPGQRVDTLPCVLRVLRPQTHHTKAAEALPGEGRQAGQASALEGVEARQVRSDLSSQSPDTEGSSGMAQPQGAHRLGR